MRQIDKKKYLKGSQNNFSAIQQALADKYLVGAYPRHLIKNRHGLVGIYVNGLHLNISWHVPCDNYAPI
jgi:hypothetical protein